MLIFLEKINNYDINICKLNFASFLRTVYLLNPVILLFYTENGLGVKELFLFQSIFYLTCILLEIPIGHLSDFVSKKTSLITSYVFFFLTIFIWFFFQGYWAILTGEILFAFSKVLVDNAQSGYLYDYLYEKNRNDEMSNKYAKLNFFLAIGTTIAAIIGTYLYSTFGSKIVLAILLLISIVCILLVTTLDKDTKKHTEKNLHLSIMEKIKQLYTFLKETRHNKSIMYYIYYSGLLSAFSIFFALSFQPLLYKISSPIFFFGVVALSNHGVRAIFSALTCKILNSFRIKTMIIPLYILYIIAFCSIGVILIKKDLNITISLIFLICLIIGCQLMFSIRHISRLHTLVSSKNRGKLISINNLFSRSTGFVILFSLKYFMDNIGFENYYLILFCIFAPLGFILMLKVNGVKE